MKNKADLVARVEFPIPRNKNTLSVLEEITIYIAESFGGATQIVSRLGGFWYDQDGSLHNEDIVIFIIYYKPEEIPEADEIFRYIAKLLIDSGEIESWIIHQDEKKIIYK